MIDQRTPHLSLPLPAADNDLAFDVSRLRAAITAIDGKFQSLDNLLASDDATLDQVQEIVDAIKQNRDGVLDLIGDKATKAELSAAIEELNAVIAGVSDSSLWIKRSTDFIAAAGSRNNLLASLTVSLPAGPSLGDTVEFIKLVGVTPIIQTTDGTQILIKGLADTSVTYNYDARLLAVFNGTAWEI